MNYLTKKIISSNNYSTVYKAINNDTGETVVIKKIDKGKYEQLFKKKFNEIKITESENRVKIIETINHNDYYYIIMKYYINLEDYIDSKEFPLNKNEIKQILIQINSYLKQENQNLMLKMSKIFISFQDNKEFIIKISDFGLNEKREEDSITTDIQNSLIFKSLEYLEENKTEENSIWSLGIILYYMCFKEYPFNANNEFKLVKEIKRKKLKKPKNSKLADLLEKMLEKSPERRISLEDYFDHSFFKIKKKKIPFIKMNSFGNDCAIFDFINDNNDFYFSKSDIIIKSDRNFGIGCEKLITLYKSNTINENEDEINISAKIYIINGNELLNNLNGIRCIAGYIKNKYKKKNVNIEINNQIIKISLEDDERKNYIKINMGIPIVKGNIVKLGDSYKIVSVQNFDNIKKDTMYNINYIQIISKNHIFVKCLEKCSGEILSSEVGSCASVAWGIENKILINEVKVYSRGSNIFNSFDKVYWEGNGHPIFITGNYEFVYNGFIEI